MTLPAKLRDIFFSRVTRDIAPVVWFHEKSPDKLKAEVEEYIITGGWNDGERRRRLPNGIHEQAVRLLRAISDELDRKDRVDLPVVWISGFYGSGKSSFAKLLGYALDGVALPGGGSLAEALLERDTSPRRQELRDAWNNLRAKIDPLAVVLDVGGLVRGNEQLHSIIVRQLQERLQYCSKDAIVADFELDLERDGKYEKFLAAAEKTLGKPWSAVKDQELAEEDFSLVMHKLEPDKYRDPMSWYASRSGTRRHTESVQDAIRSIADMLRFRSPRSTVFFVADEVSQFVLGNKPRVDALRAFATALGADLGGKAWLWALGQQKLDEQADDSFLVWAKDRFPQRLRVHLEPTNIRDVVHQRLLRKKPAVEPDLRALYREHEAALRLYGYKCADLTEEEFVEVYPLLPHHVELIGEITSAMRASSLAQGDAHAIRGLLQLLGELFRSHGLADAPVGTLITFDQVYDVQRTALSSDTQNSMSRILAHCASESSDLKVRVAKAVALLELVQKKGEAYRTDARLVAQCILDRVDRGKQDGEVAEALDALYRAGLLSYAETTGYKIQSTAGEAWSRERDEIPVSREEIVQIVQESLKYLMAKPTRPRLDDRPFRWEARFSDGRQHDDVSLVDPRDEAPITVDFRLLFDADDRLPERWVRGADPRLQNRLVWVCGDPDALDTLARDYARAREMVRKYDTRELQAERKLLLQQEKNRAEELAAQIHQQVARTYLAGQIYFRGEPTRPPEIADSFDRVLETVAARHLRKIYPYHIATQVAPSELEQLLKVDLAGPPEKFMQGDLGILALDAGRLVFACSGTVPTRVYEHIHREGGVTGQSLLAHFGGPPYGYTANVLRACVLGLLRAKRVKLRSEGGATITDLRDAGAQDLFDKDRNFRRATISPADEDEIGMPIRAKICDFFKKTFGHEMDREDSVIADAVARFFPLQAPRLRAVLARLAQLPGNPTPPATLIALQDALEQCLREIRQTLPTLRQVKKHLTALRDGLQTLGTYESELTSENVDAVREAARVRDHHAAQLRDTGVLAEPGAAALERITAHLTGERPWRDISTLADDLRFLQGAYVAERRRLLQWQEEEAERARSVIKTQPGFGTLTADQSHRVLRPFAAAVTSTGPDAVAPTLRALVDDFTVALTRAQHEAQDHLDRILSEGDRKPIVPIDLNIRNRHLASEADVEALLSEIRERLLAQVRAGTRVRIA
ncbi:MAG: BREX system P-loop protein BrxC [Myxococcales bacterium]|nr:BREX system P-loop protein BrxC [Myxococcales bacterium]